MNAVPKRKSLTVEEFLDWEARQEERYELIDGEIVAMVGGTLRHQTITLNIAQALGRRLGRGPCRRFIEARVVTVDGSFFPDVVVTCSQVDELRDTVPEPIVIFEVLSDSTEARDRYAKSRAYRGIGTLRQLLLVAQNVVAVESFVPANGVWGHEAVLGADAVLTLPSLDLSLPLAEIYADTDLRIGPAGVTAPAPAS